jgi:CspA family cold shock protein
LEEGTVKWFNEKKGYGFIKQDEGADLFVHYSSIAMPGFKHLVDGDRVSFTVEETERGPQAINVRTINP